MTARIERLVTSGTFELDGGSWEVGNNVWLIWELIDGEDLTVAGTELRVLHTPGHSPGSVCLYVPELNVLFSGDTLFQGGPGATGRSFSDCDTIVASIRDRLRPPDPPGRDRGHGRLPAPAHPDPARPLPEGRGLHVRQHPGRALRPRPAP